MRIQALLVTALLLAGSVVGPSARADDPPGSPVAEAPKTKDLAALVASVRRKHPVPALGGAVVVGKRGGVVALGVDGVRAEGSDVEVERGDLWHLGSCTKSMTATLLARLADQGRMAMDETLAKAFPQIEVHASHRKSTLDRLLAHRAGFPASYPPALWGWLYRHEVDPRAQRVRIAREVLVGAPPHPVGDYLYSNMGFDLVGAALEQRTDLPFETLMKRALFTPLGMTSASFGPPGSVQTIDQPRGHRVVGERLVPVPPVPLADNPRSLSPAGRACMSLEDWGRYIALHLGHVPSVAGEEGVREPFLQKATLARLHATAEGESYAHGWIHHQRPWAGGTCLSHAGSNTLWFAVCWVAPKKDFAVLAVTNVAGRPGTQATNALIDRLLAWHLER